MQITGALTFQRRGAGHAPRGDGADHQPDGLKQPGEAVVPLPELRRRAFDLPTDFFRAKSSAAMGAWPAS